MDSYKPEDLTSMAHHRMQFLWLKCIWGLILSLSSPILAQDVSTKPATAPKAVVKPIRALLITGGCCHDYEKQKKILTEGISARALVQWEIVHQGGSSTNSKIPYYENPDWARGFDIVVHNECFADAADPKWTDRVLNPHRAGIPAIVIHCAMHCYRDKTDEWFKFLGVTSHQHGAHYPFEVLNIKPEHPVMGGFGNVWLTPKGELYQIAKVWDTATPLAYAMSRETKKQEPVIWVNQYGKTRVFGTTIGHYNEEMQDPVFLNYMTRGLLWATDKLNDDYLQPFKVAAPAKKVLVPKDLALKKPATASGSQEGHAASHGNDGNEETRWCCPDGGVGYSWQVDLEKPERLTGCRILWEFDAPYRYKIEGSSDGKTWQLLSDQSAGKLETQEQVLTFEPAIFQHVRLSYLGSKPGAWGSFFEFEVHGTELVEKLVLASSTSKPRPVGGDGPLREIKAPPEFEVTLFAAPPEVTYPTCLAVSPNGALYVGIDENGSLDRQPNRGKIVRCIDSNQDGKADQFTTVTKLDSPRGLVLNGNSIFVQHPPFVSVFHDDNGDGTADRSQTLVKGLGFDLSFRGADHTTNGMQLGIDGWLYIAVGDYGFVKAEGADGRTLQMRGGGVVRVRQDGSQLEIVSRGQRNIYDVAVDPFLNLFTRDNTNDGGGWNVRLSHVVPRGQYGYPSLFINFPDEIIPPLADYGGGSPCGSLFIDDRNLPTDFARSLYTCDWGRSVVYRHPLDSQGAGFTAQQEPFVEIPRPTDMEIDGRSQIFISSWKDGGFNFSRPDVGYVIRVVPRGAVGPMAADLSEASLEIVLRQLASGSHIQRLQAQQELLRRGDQLTVPAGLEQLILSEADLAVKVAAIFTLKQLSGEKSHPTLIRLLKQDTLREFALRALADAPLQGANVPTALFVHALQDPNPRVRMQAALGLARLARADAAVALVPFSVDPDPLVAHVVIRALVDLKGSEACLRGLASPAHAPGCLRVLQELHDPRVVAGLIKQYSESNDGPSRPGILRALCRLCLTEAEWKGDWWSTRPDTSGPYYQTTDWSETNAIRQFLATQLKSPDVGLVKVLLVELKRHKIDFEDVVATIVQIAEQDPAWRPQAVALLGQRADLNASASKILLETVHASDTSETTRALALRGLHRNIDRQAVVSLTWSAFAALFQRTALPPEVQPALDEFLRDPRHAERLPAISELLKQENPELQQLAYGLLLQISDNQQIRREMRDLATQQIEASWKSPLTTVALLRAIGRTRSESQAYMIRTLQLSKQEDIKRTADLVAKQLELDQPVDPNQPVLATFQFEELQAKLKSQAGDIKQGARLFARQGCVACHTVSSNETLKGPLLAGIAARYKREELIESILKPSQKIAQGFESQFFQTADGFVHEGFVVREAGDEIELRTTNGTSLVISKTTIEERGKRTVSMMPEKLVDGLTVNQMASLLAYLESLKAN